MYRGSCTPQRLIARKSPTFTYLKANSFLNFIVYPRLYTSIFIAWGIFYKGGVFMNRNHEGYIDKTASEAIRKADASPRKRKKKLWSSHLTYFIAEVPGFYEAVNLLQR